MKAKKETWISYYEKKEAETYLNSKFINEDFFDDFDRYFRPKIMISKSKDQAQKKKPKKLVPFDKRLSRIYLRFYLVLFCYVVLKAVSLGFYVDTSILTQERDFRGDYCGVGKHSSRPFHYFFTPVGTDELAIVCLRLCPR